MVFVDDALEANDLVTTVFQKYQQLVMKNRSKTTNACLISTPSVSTASNGNGTSRNTMDELHEIFASSSSNNPIGQSNPKPEISLAPLEPTLASAQVNTNGESTNFFPFF